MTTLAIAEIISAVYAGLILIGYLMWRDDSASMRRLKMLSILTIIWLLSDAFSYIFNEFSIDNEVVFAFVYAVNMLAYIMSNLVLMALLYYCEAYLSEKIKMNKWLFRGPAIAMFVNIVIDIVYFINGNMLIFTDNHFVIVGTAPIFVLISYFLTMFYAPVIAFIKRREVGIKSFMYLCIYGIFIIPSLLALILTGVDLSVLLGSVSVIITVSLMQRELTNDHIKREATQRALVENNRRILTLEDKFESLYDVNLETGEYEMYVKGNLFADINTKLIHNNEFFEDTIKSIDVVYPDDREEALKVITRDYIRETLDRESQFDFFYRLVTDDKPIWARLRVVYKNEDKNNVIIGVFNAEEEMDAKLRVEKQRVDLFKSKLRADALSFVSDNEPDLDKFMDFFGDRMLEMSGCDQVIFSDMNGHRVVINAPGIESIPLEYCSTCPYVVSRAEMLGEAGIIVSNDCAGGFNGLKPHPDCPVKSSYIQQIYLENKPVGLFTVHYIKEKHTFTDAEVDTMKTVTKYLELLLGRIEAKQIEREKIEAESSNKAKTDFLFSMSHDIRTPMNAIIGFTNIAKKNVDNKEKLEECLEKTQQAGNLLLSLINGILDMSRIESGKAVLEESPGDVKLSFVNITSTMMELAEAKNVNLTFEIGEITNRFVYVDFERCSRVFINIITNAIKYTKDGGYVKVRCEQIGKRDDGYGLYKYTFEDNGIGMGEEFQKHVFDQFAREENSTTRGIQGTGLGLSVVKSFVDLMDGTIECESKQGEGTTFTVIIPLRLQDSDTPAEFINPDTGDAEFVKVSEETIKIDLTGKKVLVVEDNDLNREIAIDILEEVGLFVENAEDGSVAVKMMRENGPDYYDFILMDIQMPVMGGYEATETIRKMYPDAQIPIIALSANAFEEDREASLAAGMNDHVAKPINTNELYKVLLRLLG